MLRNENQNYYMFRVLLKHSSLIADLIKSKYFLNIVLVNISSFQNVRINSSFVEIAIRPVAQTMRHILMSNVAIIAISK